MHFDNEIQRFKLYLLQEKKQLSTIRRYTYDVQLYRDWLLTQDHLKGKYFDESWPFSKELPSYYSYLHRSGRYSPNTIRRVLSALRKWYHYLQHYETVAVIERYLKETKVSRELNNIFLTTEQIDKLFQSLTSYQGLTENQKKYRYLIKDRNEVIFRLILFYGVTIQELTTLRVNRIHFTSKEIEFTSRKGKIRTRKIHSDDVKKLFDYYMVIPEPVRPNRYDESPFFLAFDYQGGTYRYEKALSEVAVQKMIRQEIRRADLPKVITAQELRKNYILHQLLRGKTKDTLRGELALETAQPLDELEKWATEWKEQWS